jgi:hypothetical protein
MSILPTKAPQSPKRHWCFTTWLILALIASIYLAATSAFGLIYCVANIVLITALYKWRRWGFIGFAVIATVMFVLRLSDGVGFLMSALSFVSVVILYGVLQIGGDKKAWIYLK